MVLSKYSIIFCKDCERGGSLIEDKDFGRDLKWKKKKKKASQWLYYVLSNLAFSLENYFGSSKLSVMIIFINTASFQCVFFIHINT